MMCCFLPLLFFWWVSASVTQRRGSGRVITPFASEKVHRASKNAISPVKRFGVPVRNVIVRAFPYFSDPKIRPRRVDPLSLPHLWVGC